jgi:FkbM family methyltransferase
MVSVGLMSALVEPVKELRWLTVRVLQYLWVHVALIRILGVRSAFVFRRHFRPRLQEWWGTWVQFDHLAKPHDPAHIRVHVNALKRSVLIRPRTTDGQVLWDTFAEAHQDAPIASGGPGEIWDLGANIGLTACAYASLFPNARLVAVELDEENARLATANLAPLGRRCEVIRAAIWHEDGEVSYDRSAGEAWGFHVVSNGATPHSAPALSMNTLLERRGGVMVDFCKMDIEGAERMVLRAHTEWAGHVRSLRVEVHEPYDVDACTQDLRALGFQGEREGDNCVAAVRQPTLAVPA